MKVYKVSDEHHVVRAVSFGKLRLDEHSQPIGINYNAFLRREDEDGLSVTELEYFAGSRPDQITAAVQAIRASNFKPSPKSGFAIGNVRTIREVCAARGHKVRIIHAPQVDNAAHAEIRLLPRDDIELLEQLATGVWSEFHQNKDISPGQSPAPPQPAIPWE